MVLHFDVELDVYANWCVWVRLKQVKVLRTSPNMALVAERDFSWILSFSQVRTNLDQNGIHQHS